MGESDSDLGYVGVNKRKSSNGFTSVTPNVNSHIWDEDWTLLPF